MPSEFNHIDEFIRSREKEAPLPEGLEGQHWQQMKTLMKAPPAKAWKLPSKYFWIIPSSVIVLSAVWLLLQQKQNISQPAIEKNKTFTKPVVAEPIQQNASPVSSPFSSPPPLPPASHVAYQFLTNEMLAGFPETPSLTDSVQQAEGPIEDAVVYESFFSALKKNEQHFRIRASIDTVIYCKERTTIHIPANSFQYLSGAPVVGNVEISIQEFYEISDIIGHKLSTTSDQHIIATGGMLYLKAFANSKQVIIKKGSGLIISMPAPHFDHSMQLFYGSEQMRLQPTGNDSIGIGSARVNWVPAGQQQTFSDQRPRIGIIDLANDPRWVKVIKGKKTAQFILSDHSKLSVGEAQKELERRYGHLYQEIRVRSGWKTSYKKIENLGDYRNGLIGDSMYLSLADARRLQLITEDDSIRYEERFRKDFETTRGKGIYDQYLYLKKNYEFRIEKLGWINCDRFVSWAPQQLTDLVVDPGNQFNGTYMQSFLVFKNINSVLRGFWLNGKIHFNKVPLGQDVSVICIGVKEGKAFYAIREFSISPETQDGFEFRETSPAEFREKLKVFGDVKD